MFFSANQIKNILSCKKCNSRLEDPRVLPCSATICIKCVSSIELIKEENNIFLCFICYKKHTMPEDGLLVNELAQSMLSIEPTDVSRGQYYESLKNTLNDIQFKREYIRNCLNNCSDNIKQYFSELRNQVNVTTEQAIQQINVFNKEFLQEIDGHETTLIDLNNKNNNNKNRKKLTEQYNRIVKELDLFHMQNTESIKAIKVNDEIICKANKTAHCLSIKADCEINKLENIIFNENFWKFEINTIKLDKSMLGSLKKYDSKIMQSNIVFGHQTLSLMSVCEFSIDQKWKLVYRASQDGFEAANFHSKCDNKANTLVIVKSSNGSVFGGYTEQDWMGIGYKQDPNAFIFSFVNQTNSAPLKMKCSSDKSIYSSQSYGPIFGGGFDICIRTCSNKNKTSFTNLGLR